MPREVPLSHGGWPVICFSSTGRTSVSLGASERPKAKTSRSNVVPPGIFRLATFCPGLAKWAMMPVAPLYEATSCAAR